MTFSPRAYIVPGLQLRSPVADRGGPAWGPSHRRLQEMRKTPSPTRRSHQRVDGREFVASSALSSTPWGKLAFSLTVCTEPGLRPNWTTAPVSRVAAVPLRPFSLPRNPGSFAGAGRVRRGTLGWLLVPGGSGAEPWDGCWCRAGPARSPRMVAGCRGDRRGTLGVLLVARRVRRGT